MRRWKRMSDRKCSVPALAKGAARTGDNFSMKQLNVYALLRIIEGRPWVNAKSKIKTEYLTIQYASWTFWPVNGWINLCHVPLEFRIIVQSSVAMCWQALPLRYVDESLPSKAIGHAGRGSLGSKGTGQMSHSKAATLLTFVTVEATSVTLYIKHNYKATVAAAECVMLREIQTTLKSCTGQVTDAAVQSRGVLNGNQIEITLLHVPMTAANIKTPKLELRCSKANSISLGDKKSKQSGEHHDDTPDEEVLCLFAATPDFPKSVICNIDGVTPKFLEIGERISVVKEVVEQKLFKGVEHSFKHTVNVMP
ncbi:peroxisomal membrane protein PMP22-like protein [Tanacetum coccineum]